MSTKRCARCRLHLPLNQFSAHPAARDGKQSFCKPCAILNRKDWLNAILADPKAYLQRRSDRARRRALRAGLRAT
jgi:hypothetical protein